MQEEWIASRVAAAGPGREVRGEIQARNEIDRWPETAARALFAVVEADGTGAREVPFDYIGLVSRLPADLKTLALARIRACRNERTRLLHLAGLDAELTDAERLDIVEEPLDDPRFHEHHARYSLPGLRRHLARVPTEVIRSWLSVALSFAQSSLYEGALVTLLPFLEGDDRRAAVDQIVGIVLEFGGFTGSVCRWDLLRSEILPALTARLVAVGGSGWDADELIAHVTRERTPEDARRCLLPVLDRLPSLAPERHLEVLTAMTPWLASYSANALPLALAAIELPPLTKAPDRWYRVDRTYAFGR